MSLASFHYAFTSRDELILETMRRLVREYAEREVESDDLATDLLGALTTELNRQMDQRLASVGRSAVVLELTAIALREPGLERVAVELTEARRSMHTRLVQDWARRRGLSWRVAPDQVGSVVMATLDGLVLQWLADRDTQAVHDGVSLLSESMMLLTEPVVSSVRCETAVPQPNRLNTRSGPR